MRHSARRRFPASRGVSMIEMVVAVALLGVGVSACVACIGTATRASGAAEEYTALQLLAREKLAQFETEGVAEGEASGDFGNERPGYSWKTVTEPADVPGILEVRLTVAAGDPDRERTAQIVTLVRER